MTFLIDEIFNSVKKLLFFKAVLATQRINHEAELKKLKKRIKYLESENQKLLASRIKEE